MTNDLVKSFNAWVKNERHQSIYNFIMEHMLKLGALLVKHKEESSNWKGCKGLKIEGKVMTNIAKGKELLVFPFMNGFFTVSTRKAFVNVDMFNRSCTCKEWKMEGIPCEHACVVILSIGQNVVDFVDD